MEMISFLKRRFSSGDLQGEGADQRQMNSMPGQTIPGQSPYGSGPSPYSSQPPPPPPPAGSGMPGMPGMPSSYQAQQMTNNSTNVAAQQNQQNAAKGRAYPSAPTSPTKSYSSSISNISSNITGSITGQISNSIARGIFSSKPNYNKDRCKTLLVIDDPNTDWSKYFRNRKIFGDWDIRVEQAQFSEMSMAAYSDQICCVDIKADRSGTRVVKSFSPDFVLVRQFTKDGNDDWKNIIMGLLYAGVPSVNTAQSLFNMLDRPWMFAHLIMLRNRLGRDVFPLIHQVYYPNHFEMASSQQFPLIVKMGQAHGGIGKTKVDNPMQLQDTASLVAVTNNYATNEPFIDAKYDLHIQKIGNNYKSFVRKSISGSWKVNSGSAILEQVPMTEKFRVWVDEASRLFGGLDVCCIEAIQSKTGEYHIVDMSGSDMMLLGETQEEDRRLMSELVLQKMQMFCKPTMTKTSSMGQDGGLTMTAGSSSSSIASSSVPPAPLRPAMTGAPSVPSGALPNQSNATGMTPPTRPVSGVSDALQNHVTMTPRPGTTVGSSIGGTTTSTTGIGSSIGGGIGATPSIPPRPMPTTGLSSTPPVSSSLGSASSGIAAPPPRGPPPTGLPGAPSRPGPPPVRQTSRQNSGASLGGTGDDGDDTMKNLRKTFAGIFGDM